ncbi:MFS transporter [Blastopirellula marina]|uniref:General substrate transporter:Major facilitator superfamily protein n=1 Tax=Blastopirellula marina DSM 3645 TaxID=314230 RepID=A4A2F6_9BACT|nr:MFS transporter [Blastopirellula marina]EAQ77070.1 General substrate transporter:Major facilitator superfamily protein [Blastopirellula marina DSM 3645]
MVKQDGEAPEPAVLIQPSTAEVTTREIADQCAPDGKPPTAIRYRVVAWLTAAAALAYLCRNSLGIAESQIRDDLGLTLSQSGHVMGAFFWSYAFFQVPTGAFSHRFGTRLALTIFAIAWSVTTLFTAISPGLWLLITAQLLMGIAQAGIFPASTNTVNYWMPMSTRSLACGVLSAGMQVGAITASIVTGLLLSVMSWRWSFALISLPGVLWALAFYFRFRDRPGLSPEANAAERTLIQAGRPRAQIVAADDDIGPTDWKAVLLHPGLWLIHGQQICRAAGYMFFVSWFPTFLQETRGVSIEHSGYMQGVVLAGALVGSLLGGMLTDGIWRKTGSLWLSRSGVGATALGVCSVLILCSWFVEDLNFAIGLLAFGVLFAQLASPAMFAAVIDISGSRAAQVLGAVNMTGNLAVAVCPILVGILFEQTANWNLVLILFAAIYLIGAIFWAFVDTRKGIFDKAEHQAEIARPSNAFSVATAEE